MAARGGAAGMALGGWDLMVRPSRWWWRAGGGRTGERRQQVLVGTAERVPTAPPGLEADLEGERSAVGPSLGHGRPRPRPVRSTRIGMTAATGAPLSGFGVGACRVARGTPSPERRMPRCLTRDGELARDRDAGSRHAAAPGDLHASGAQARPPPALDQQRMGGLVEG